MIYPVTAAGTAGPANRYLRNFVWLGKRVARLTNPFRRRNNAFGAIFHGSALNFERGRRAEEAIARGDYLECGTRDDGALVMSLDTRPPLVVVARLEAREGGKPDLILLAAVEVKGRSA